MWARSDGKHLRVRIGYIVHNGVEFGFSAQSLRVLCGGDGHIRAVTKRASITSPDGCQTLKHTLPRPGH